LQCRKELLVQAMHSVAGEKESVVEETAQHFRFLFNHFAIVLHCQRDRPTAQ
jgi:hypothetical protein